MKRTMIAALTVIVAIGLAGPVAAELCEKCRGQMYIMSIGKCTSCGGHTSSGAFKLCKKCSAEQGKCQHCLAHLDGGKLPGARPDPAKPERPRQIDLKKSATYRVGNWQYELRITHPGTRSEGRWGELHYNDKELPDAQINDYYLTPWGRIYWIGIPKRILGDHGWMTAPALQVQRKGKRLTPPAAPATTAKLTDDDDGKTITVGLGRTVAVYLAGNPTTGYLWKTGEIAGSAVRQVGEPQYLQAKQLPERPPRLGAGGTYVFIFTAAKPGRATIKLIYVRPWEKGKPPARTFTATIVVPPGNSSALRGRDRRLPSQAK